MSGTSRRGLLKGALAGSVSLIRAPGALGFALTGGGCGAGALSGAAVSGAPGGPAASVQYNAGSGNFGGIANFELTPAGMVKTIPPPSLQSPIPEPCLVSGRNAPKKLRP
jgi:hypothetical protein